MLLHNLYINVRLFCCILKVSATFLSRDIKISAHFMLHRAKKLFFVNISKTIHFKVYVASQVLYTSAHCECFAESEKSVRPSQAKIQNYPNTRLKWKWAWPPWINDSGPKVLQ